eukprot:CAMPEP_0115579896 /NCGR_PEP_ID=MMETSP0272-20121206/4338_1 /TAXON_ID=71861 /ORGANISM="Scrippsiella trochoidea, Strain CCMP3099" /LENGTH=1576 /DNA_ID=CAMNT_0003014781 /DNA_START=21 /DNA_END=4751 /DNA_ORIENTATION=+
MTEVADGIDRASAPSQVRSDHLALQLVASGQAHHCAHLCRRVYDDPKLDSTVDGCDLDIIVGPLRAWVLGLQHNASDVIQIVFRGTVTDTHKDPTAVIQNIMTDLDIQLQSHRPAPRWEFVQPSETLAFQPRVHAGFQGAFWRLWKHVQTQACINDLIGKNAKFRVLGHSLGGAMAALAAVHLRQSGVEHVEVVAFGTPQVGDPGFEKLYKHLGLIETSVFFTNAVDPVPRLPLAVPGLVDDGWEGVYQQLAGALAGCTIVRDDAPATSYCHPCPTHALDVASVMIAGLPATLRSFSTDNGVTAAIHKFVSYHSMTTYIKALECAAAPLQTMAADMLLPILGSPVLPRPSASLGACQSPDVSAQSVTSFSVDSFGMGLSCLKSVMNMMQGSAALASVFGTYVACRRLDCLSDQLRCGLERSSHAAQKVSCEVERASRQIEQIKNQMDNIKTHITQGFDRVERTVRDAADQAVLKNIILEVKASSKILQDDVNMLLRQCGHDTEAVRLNVYTTLERLRQAVQKLFEATRDKLNMALTGQPEQVSALVTLAMSSWRLFMFAAQVLRSDRLWVSQLSASIMPQLAEALGRLYFFGATSPQSEQWSQALAAEQDLFLQSVLGCALSTESGAASLKQEFADMGALEQSFARLSFDPLSGLLRRRVIEDAGKASLGVDMLAALTFLTCVAHQADPSSLQEACFNAGLAWALQVSRPISAAQESVSWWARCVASGGDVCSMLTTASAVGLPIDWQSLSAEVEQQQHVRLAIHLHGVGVLSSTAVDWLKQVADLHDLPDCGSDSLASLRQAIVDRENNNAETSLSEVEAVLQNFSAWIERATLGKQEREQITTIRSNLDRGLNALKEEKDYVVFAGGVSAGKTSLVNALVSTMLPAETWSELEVEDDQQTLLPTDFGENTAIVTEIEFFNPGEDASQSKIEVRELRCDDHASDLEIAEMGGAPARPFENLREVQKYIKDLCQRRPQDGLLQRLLIRLPSSKIASHPISIIDTPGMESPGVEKQIRPLLSARAFLLVWVAALDSSQVVGQQGQELLNFYNSMPTLLPPLLVMTRWDVLVQRPEFSKIQKRRKFVQKRVRELQERLQSTVPSNVQVSLDDEEARQEVLQSLSTDGSAYVLSRDLSIGGKMLTKGAELVHGELEVEKHEPAWPIRLVFSQRQLTRPSLAVTNAACMLDAEPDDLSRKESAAQGIEALWGERILPLLDALSTPLRLCKHLDLVRNAAQQLVDEICKDDRDTLFSNYMDNLEKLSGQCLEKLRLNMAVYFARLPRKFKDEDSAIDDGRQPLQKYTPLAQLADRDATCKLLEDLTAAFDARCTTGVAACQDVRAIANEGLRAWGRRFSDNLNVFRANATNSLLDQISSLADCEASSEMLATLPLPACGLAEKAPVVTVKGVIQKALYEAGGSSALLSGGSGLIRWSAAEGLALSGGALSGGALLGGGALLAGGILLGMAWTNVSSQWNRDEAVTGAAEMVLSHMAGGEFQKVVTEFVLYKQKAVLDRCLTKVKALRCKEIRGAADLQEQVDRAYRSLTVCFAELHARPRSSQWLLSPPQALEDDLNAADV